MKMERVRLPVVWQDAVIGDVTGVLKIPREFIALKTPSVILAHGAGGSVDDPALSFVLSYLVGRGFLTLSFNFPYREKGRKTPDREGVLEATILSAVGFLRHHPVVPPGLMFIGGKSMGGRIASHLASAHHDVATGLILLAYPLHAPGRPDRVRDGHLPGIRIPTLFLSGTRDALAPSDALKVAAGKVPHAHLVTLEGADHSFNMPRKSPMRPEDVWQEVAEAVANWLETVLSSPSESSDSQGGSSPASLRA